MKLKSFSKFENTSDEFSKAKKLIKIKQSKDLCKFLHAHCNALVVPDSKLGIVNKDKLVKNGKRIKLISYFLLNL